MHISIHTYNVHISVYTCINTYTHIRIFIYIYTERERERYMNGCMYVCMNVRMYVCITNVSMHSFLDSLETQTGCLGSFRVTLPKASLPSARPASPALLKTHPEPKAPSPKP